MADEVQCDSFAAQDISCIALDYQERLTCFYFLATLFFIGNRCNSEPFKDKCSYTGSSYYAIFASAYKGFRSLIGIDSCNGGLIVTFGHILRKGMRDEIFELFDMNAVTR